ncbi:hypothetical protein BDQ17DRAFT_1374176 [Cyathus striatus]|nr:hypothetical protein BDQ17DRAFT_1374176 [Cyathus striatus]
MVAFAPTRGAVGALSIFLNTFFDAAGILVTALESDLTLYHSSDCIERLRPLGGSLLTWLGIGSAEQCVTFLPAVCAIRSFCIFLDTFTNAA